jgi:putative MATE family efflux protein
MKENAIKLSKRDIEFREFSLNGNMWYLVAYVCIPLAIFQMVTHIFNLLDTLIAAHISADAVSAVAYLAQIQMIISAIGSGLAIGGSIKISEAYGAGDYKLVKKRLSSIIFLCIILGGGVLLLMPFTTYILRISGTPKAFIDFGTRYFNITLVATVISFFNNVYIAIERARGKSKRIMYLNTFIIVLKLGLTALFVYKLNSSITMIAVATIISQSVLFFIAVKNMSDKYNVFGFSFKFVSLKKEIFSPVLKLSVPVMIQRSSFSVGKTIVNSMSKIYGNLTVGALGISNNINGVVTNMQIGFQDGGASIISQNMGAGKFDRAVKAFKVIIVFNVTIGFFGWLILNIFINKISFIFANSIGGIDVNFQETIIKVFIYDSFGSCLPLGISISAMALLFGLGYSKLTLLINFCRIFAFRIPVLWWLQNYTDMGSESMGIVMAVSNISVAVLSIIIVSLVIKKERKT